MDRNIDKRVNQARQEKPSPPGTSETFFLLKQSLGSQCGQQNQWGVQQVVKRNPPWIVVEKFAVEMLSDIGPIKIFNPPKPGEATEGKHIQWDVWSDCTQ